MEGVASDENLRGIMPNSFSHIFDYIDSKANSNIEFLVRASFLEIYLDEVYDLLNSTTRAKMEVKESKDKGIFVKDLSTYVVKNANEIAKVMRKGQKSRQVGATAMNPGSSRSHSIFTIMIETCEVRDGENHYRAGKLNLVDLAGSCCFG
jgi:kinesin family protein 3/17